MLMAANPRMSVCLALTRAISLTQTVEEIYTAALDALAEGLGVGRSAILLFDPDGVMRFKAHRGLSDTYRSAVEGHTPWRADTPDAQPIVVANVASEASLRELLPVIEREGIGAMAFIPLLSLHKVIGKFMLYYPAPYELTPDDLQLAGIIAAQVAFAVERTRAEEKARLSEERLRFALEAAAMGTWDWDLNTNHVRWSANLEQLHGLPAKSFDGTFASYQREIHPEDQERVLGSVRRAIELGVPHEAEYRVVAPDGTVRWVEGKGRVAYDRGRAVGMSGVCMMVTRRKEAELARIAAAEEASRLKDEFLATLSHELRTPLNAILGWVQILKSDGFQQDRVRHALDIIGRNARLQAQLIEDILDVSRIITGKLEIDRMPMLLDQLVETVTSGLQPAADEKRISMTRVIAPDLPAVEGDAKRLQQVFGNVLSNAIKFTPEDGTIAIRCSRDGSGVAVEVRDSGAGIDPAFLPYVFDRFRQADSRATRRHGGLGLGLAIARHLVEQHRGEIHAHSDGPGRGATITIRLPGAHERTAVAPVATVETSTPIRLQGRRVLVVDDQQDARELLAALLTRCGAEVLQCDSAEAALDAVSRAPVDLLVADIAMPDVDGCELIRSIRRHRRALPAIAVSAYARPQDRKRAIAAGYQGYCAKPVEAGELLHLVSAALPRG
ncbi:MAG TPA: ATP-binding protein [Vicinamibacterales bacterium]|nr:ATP-binding protein [Vicinamibacterales bacterium]